MKKFFLVAVAALMVCFTSCNKDSLEGTRWTTQTSMEIMEGMNADMALTLAFNTETEGAMEADIMMGGQSLGKQSVPFTYTFDGEKGTLTAQDEEIPLEEASIDFTRTDKDHIVISEEGMEMIFTKE